MEVLTVIFKIVLFCLLLKLIYECLKAYFKFVIVLILIIGILIFLGITDGSFSSFLNSSEFSAY